MAENRYSVDDILRELNSKQYADHGPDEGRPSAAPNQTPTPRRPAPSARPPQREWEPVAQPAVSRPRREPPAGVREAPRLGQTLQAPRNREEMGQLLGNFDDGSDPLGDLGFLSREPEVPSYASTPARSFVPDWEQGSFRNVPAQGTDYSGREDAPTRPAPIRQPRPEQPVMQQQRRQPQPQPQPRPEQPVVQQQRRQPQPQGWESGYGQPGPQRSAPARQGGPVYTEPMQTGQQPMRPQQPSRGGYPAGRDYGNPSPPSAQAEAPRRAGSPHGGYPSYDPSGSAQPLRGGARREMPPLYESDRRSMADAARLITTGGFGDLSQSQAQQPMRQQQPAPTAPIPQRPMAPSQQPSMGQDYRQPPGQPLPDEAGSPGVPPSARATRQRPSTAMPSPDDIFGTPEPPRAKPTGSRRMRPAQEHGDAGKSLGGARQEDPPVADVGEALNAFHQENAPHSEAPKETGGKHTENQQVAQQLNAMRTSLLLRVVVNLLTLMGVVYLVLAAEYELPLPGFMAGAENVAAFLWSIVGLVILSAVVSGNTVGGGMLALLKLRPSNDSYSALAVFACLIQGAYMAMQPQLMESYSAQLYLPMAALMLLFNTLGKLIMLSRMGGSFGFITTKGEKHVADIMDNREFARRISGDIVGEEPRIAYFTDSLGVESFLDQAFSGSKAEDISKMVAPMTALAALVMALVSYLFSRDIFISACVYTAALCITAPLAGVIASNLPLSITNGKLARFGAALCGYDAVSCFSDVNGVLLRCSQLFPKGSVAIQEIKILDRRPIDQVILDAASVLCSCDSDLTGIFRDMVPNAGILSQPENLEYYDDMGLSAWVNGRRVLIGNRSLMVSYGVSIPDVEFEKPYTTGNNEVLYLANSGEAAAMYVLTYRADKQMRRAMELLCDRDMAVCVYSTDPNLTADKISTIYSFPKELIAIIPASMQPGCERYMGTKGRVKATVVHNGSPASYLRTMLAAQSCSRCVTIETALLLLSVGIGFGIVTFFAFTRQMEALTWVTIAIYQFFWLLIELVVPLMKH